MAAAGETQLDSVMDEAFSLEAFADTGLGKKINGSLLQHTGADALFTILAGTGLENDRFDSLEMQQVGEHQSGGAGAYDSDLRARKRHWLRRQAKNWYSKNDPGFPAGPASTEVFLDRQESGQSRRGSRNTRPRGPPLLAGDGERQSCCCAIRRSRIRR